MVRCRNCAEELFQSHTSPLFSDPSGRIALKNYNAHERWQDKLKYYKQV